MANDKGQVPETPTSTDGAFSADYVRSLREENAGWRNKVRDLEVQVASQAINQELSKRGIKAEPHWVNVAEGQTPEQAVEAFAAKYPNLATQAGPDDQEAPDFNPVDRIHKQVKVDVKPQPPKKRTIKQQTTPQELLRDRKFAEIKKDPKARAMLAKHYRGLVLAQSHRPNYEE